MKIMWAMDFTHLKILQYRFSDVLLLLRKIEDNEKTQWKSNKYIYMEFLQRDINIALAKHLLFSLILSKNVYYT